MAKRTYQVTFSNSGGALDSEKFDVKDGGETDAGEYAATVASRMIKEAGSLSPGDSITVTEL